MTEDNILSYSSDELEIGGLSDDSDEDKTWLLPDTNKTNEGDNDDTNVSLLYLLPLVQNHIH